MNRLVALIFSILLLCAAPLWAQDQPGPDYAAWDKLAGQAEQILESGQANDARLQAIRGEVVKWRDRFSASQGTNSTRIATLKDQIAALGPVPEEGKTESPDIAARRSELNEELSVLQAPGLKAVESYGRADGIIQQIDRTVRERQANALMRLTPTPLNPANWAPAAKDGLAIVLGIYDEAKTNWTNRGGVSGFSDSLPALGGFLLLSIFLLTRGRRWIDSLPERLSNRASDRSRAAVNFLVSLGQIAIPFVGVVMGVVVLLETGLFGDWGRPFIEAVPAAALSVFGGIWLARRLFPTPNSGLTPPLPMPEDVCRKARFRASILALAVGLHQIFGWAILPLSGFQSQSHTTDTIPLRISDASAGVWHFPLILLGSLFLFRLCEILRRLGRYVANENPDYRVRITAFLGTIGRVIAVIAPLLAAVGYVAAANALLWPTATTLGLIGLLILLQDFVGDFYAMALAKGDSEARDSLFPMLIGFVLVILSLPLFVLIWGARTSDLGEAWTKAQGGLSLGGINLSPMVILTFVIVFCVGYALTRFLQGALRSSILPKTKIDAGGQNAITSGIGYLGIGLAALLAVNTAGIDLSSLAIVAGALSVGIGFGMQQVVSNFVSGIILLIERPVTVGDWIDVGGKQGIVKRMSVRATQIQTFDRTDVIVPNSDLITQPVTNWTRGNLSGRIIVPVGVAYGSDTRHVARILQEIAEDQPTVLINPAPFVVFKGFGADALNFEIRAVLSDINGGTGVTSEINHEIAARFAKEGIEMPFPQRDIWLRNPECLHVEPVKLGPPEPEPEKAEPEPSTQGKPPRSDEMAHGA
ncbi:DUF3772 domain-containing protein [Paracoccus sulfuroxidans]|uniref:Small-conductance mechanosensitive channel n=1 Tax=Paracoccus sulfuroxidans TaxID=384678 RepID=A0A562NXB7_9RHOB|nr:DUF3772 domain-containing protein [Paracoccus sulfuroxidans]TWI36844.1 small-conductance mechanosensitive channel [Paracoccus sulfuroxidans]